MKGEGVTRGYLFDEDAELGLNQIHLALQCLSTLVEGEQPTPEQWSGMFHVLAKKGEAITASAVFVQAGAPLHSEPAS